MITTKRCQLVRFKEEHRKFYCNLQNNSQVRKHLGGIPSKNHINISIDRIINTPSNVFWIVKETSGDEPIGMISLEESTRFKQVEMSYEFMPEWWGKGYASETILEVLDYAFNTYCLNTLIAITQSKNIKSRTLLENNGMKRIQIEIMFDEEQSIYQLSKDDFLKNQIMNDTI